MRFVFRDKVFKVGFAVQVARNVCDLEPALLKIVQGFLKQTVVVGLEPDFAVVAEKDTVFLQLTWVGKPLFVVGAGWPWIAEINKNPVNGVARVHCEKNSFNIVREQQDIIRSQMTLRKGFNDLPPCHAEPVSYTHLKIIFVESAQIWVQNS